MNELRQQIYEIQRSLGRMEGTLNEIKEDIKDGNVDNNDRDKKISKLEGRQNWAAGASFIIGSVVTYFMHNFKF